MPKQIYISADPGGELLMEWINEIVNAINKYHKVIVSVIHTPGPETGIEFRIKKLIARVVNEVSKKATLNELLIEGGSTTSEILKSLEINSLKPFQELETGVIRMKVDSRPGLYLTTKPGSYYWPEIVWMQEEIKRYNEAI